MTVVTLRPRPKVENPELLLQDLPRLSLDDATRDGLTDRLLRALEVSTGRVGIACRLSTQLMLRGESRAALPIIDQLVMQNPQSIDAHCELVDLDWESGCGTNFLQPLSDLTLRTGRKRFAAARRLHRAGHSEAALDLLSASACASGFAQRDQLARLEILADMRRPDEEEAALYALRRQWPNAVPVQRALLTSAWREGGPQKLLETFGELKPGKGQVAYPLASACLQTLQWGGLIDSARLFFDAEIAGRYADDKIRPDLWQLMLSGPDAADALETFLPELEARPLATWLRADFVLAARSALAARKVFLGEAIARMGLYVWPGSPQLVNQLSRALFLQGAWSDAAAVIEAARTRYPGQDAYRQQLRALLLRQGDVAGAGALFDPNPRSAAATNSEILFRLEVARKLGNAQDMMRLGGMLIQPTYPEQVQRDAAATDATVLEGDLEEAKARAEMLYDSYPHRPALLKEVGRVHLLSGRFAQAHKMHARALRRERASSALAGYQPPRDIQDLLLPYARPTTAVESAFDAVHALSPTEQIEVLLKQPMPDPTNPVGWMLFLSRWMHSDFARFTDPLNGGAAAEAIPRTVIQFWEGPTLEPVRLCQESWQQHLTDHEFLTFDPVTARQWLADNAEPRLLQLYDGANGPAVRADIFRLAYLSREGGVYIDVDERLRQPMPPWLTGGAGLVVCHERWHGTLGNTFLAAAPNHPALLSVCAELMAQEELTGGIDTWLETGPGLITRTLGHWLFETFARNGDSGGLKIVPQRDYNGVVSSNLPFPHKFSEAHWRH